MPHSAPYNKTIQVANANQLPVVELFLRFYLFSSDVFKHCLKIFDKLPSILITQSAYYYYQIFSFYNQICYSKNQCSLI